VALPEERRSPVPYTFLPFTLFYGASGYLSWFQI